MFRKVAEDLARSRRERVGRDGIGAPEVQSHRLAKLPLGCLEFGDRDGSRARHWMDPKKGGARRSGDRMVTKTASFRPGFASAFLTSG